MVKPLILPVSDFKSKTELPARNERKELIPKNVYFLTNFSISVVVLKCRNNNSGGSAVVIAGCYNGPLSCNINDLTQKQAVVGLSAAYRDV